jgi:hypothetical protein
MEVAAENNASLVNEMTQSSYQQIIAEKLFNDMSMTTILPHLDKVISCEFHLTKII